MKLKVKKKKKLFLHEGEVVHINKVCQMQNISVDSAIQKYWHIMDDKSFIKLSDLKIDPNR